MKQEELRDKFNLQVLPASVQLEDGTWKELFNREQYNEVIDYLFAIGFIDGMLEAERYKVIEIVTEGLKTTETYTERDEQIVQNIITKLNQLKEE